MPPRGLTCHLSLGSHSGDDAWSQAVVSRQKIELSSRCHHSHSCVSCCWLPSRTHRLVSCTRPTSPLHGSLAFLHTSPWQQDPNKKAVVEKAVDNLKEKKSKSMDVSTVLKLHGYSVWCYLMYMYCSMYSQQYSKSRLWVAVLKQLCSTTFMASDS